MRMSKTEWDIVNINGNNIDGAAANMNEKNNKTGASHYVSRLLRLVCSFFSDFLEHCIEFFGISVFFIGLASVVAIVSYCSEDPSLNTAIDGTVSNLMFLSGSYYSDFMMQVFGGGAYVFSFILLSWGYQLVRYHTIAFYRAVACFVAMVCSSSALYSSNSLMFANYGGICGEYFTNMMRHFHVSVSALNWIFFCSFVVALVIAIRLDFVAIVSFCERVWKYLITKLQPDEVHKISLINFGMDRDKNVRSPQDDGGNFLTSTSSEISLNKGERRLSLLPKSHNSSKQRQEKEREYDFVFPPLNLLKEPQKHDEKVAESELKVRADTLVHVLNEFGIDGEITDVGSGPVVTLYELRPAPGIKSARVIGLASDIARNMSTVSARIAVIPGKNALGIELPNAKRQTVFLREILESSVYKKSVAALPIALGKNIGGGAIVTDLAKMPHLLIAGTTGSGKSVGINAMVLSLLYKLSPAECKFIMIDPKMLELSVYDDIPHLLTPVVTDPKKAVVALKWAVKEMESRYKAMSKVGVRNIEGYNSKLAALKASGEPLTRRVHTGFDSETGAPIYEDQQMDMDLFPYIVIIVDEMADLMLVAGKDIEIAVQRLAQMARAAGIHLIMATQRPSVDVITGTIKANFPTRISFQVSSKIDSRTILGEQGAEQLLGQGDMLYMASGGRMMRIHCPFVSDEEVEHITQHLKDQGEPQYITSILEEDGEDSEDGVRAVEEGGDDPMYKEAVSLVLREGKASTSFLQRHLKIGYNRAARIIDMMEAAGIVSSANHVGKREVIGR